MNKLKKFLPILLVLCVLTIVYSAKMYVHEDIALNSEIENIYLETGNIWKTTTKARAYLSADQTGIIHNTWTKILLNAETYDLGSNFDTSLHRFIAPVSGYYQVNWCLQWQSTTADIRYISAIRKNGNQIASHYMQASCIEFLSIPGADIVHLIKGDYIELWGYHSSEVNKDANGASSYTYLSIHILSKD